MIDLGAVGMEFDGWEATVLSMVLRWLLSYALSKLGSQVMRRHRRRQLGRRHGSPSSDSDRVTSQDGL